MGAKSSKNTTQNNRSDGHLLEYFRNTFVRGGGGTNATAPSGLTATGGVISDYSDPGPGAVYRAHIFTSTGTFNVTAPGTFGDTVEYLVVAGGGGGGAGYYGGGGGAGGVRTNLSGHPLSTNNPSFPVSTTGGNGSGSYTVTIGSGGGAGSQPPGNGSDGSNGIDSYFGPPSTPAGITAKGGGKGMGRQTSENGNTAGYPGGSGGGIAYNGPAVGYGYNPSTPAPVLSPVPLPSPYTITQGYPGGIAPNTNYFGSGGGGAGGPGAEGGGPLNHGGDGGAGVQILISGPPTFTGVGATGPSSPYGQWFAGGGAGGGGGTNHADRYGGGANPSGSNTGTGPFAGGGNGGDSTENRNGTSGTFATGGGGGGGKSGTPGGAGNGGSGIVVVRYQIAQLTAVAKATGGAISYYGGKTIHTFTSTGTFINPASISDVEIVMVAGGGAGGVNIGGGGGAGAVLQGSSITLPASTYTITVGSGGAGRRSQGPATPGTASNTTISFPGPFTWTANRGGYGASYPDIAVQPGGSGGGGASDVPTGGSSTSTPSTTPLGTLTSYGFAGSPSSGNYQGAGGGGAGQAGQAPPTPGQGGNGGFGRRLPATFHDPVVAPGPGTGPQVGGGLGSPGPLGGYYVAGGGGGSSYPTSTTSGGSGGYGGGGAGAFGSENPPATDAQSGIQNTGSGGGGAGYSPTNPSTSGNGGSGIVLIAYPS